MNKDMKKSIKLFLLAVLFINILLLTSCNNHIHTFDEGVVINEATCLIEGLKEYKCISCNKVKEEQIPKIEHIESLWMIIEKPTCTKDGEKQKVCTMCNETLKIDSISMIPHNYIEGICQVCRSEDMEYINNIDYSKKLQYKLNNDQKSYSVIGVNGYKYQKLIIPSTYNGLPVTTIGEKAFYQYINLEIVEMSDNITMIDKYAFSGCLNLKDIVFSKKLVEIEEGAFYNCYDLENIILPTGLLEVGERAFASCIELQGIIIPNTVIKMGYYVFKNCGDLIIYCEVDELPSGWNVNWNYKSYPVVWGYEE